MQQQISCKTKWGGYSACQEKAGKFLSRTYKAQLLNAKVQAETPNKLPEEVLLVCRRVFDGANAQIRKPKKIRDVLQQNQGKVLPLVNKYGMETVANGVQRLLEKKEKLSYKLCGRLHYLKVNMKMGYNDNNYPYFKYYILCYI